MSLTLVALGSWATPVLAFSLFVDPLVYSTGGNSVNERVWDVPSPGPDFLSVLEASASALRFRASKATVQKMWELTGRPGVQTAHRVAVVFNRIASLRKTPCEAVILKSSPGQTLDPQAWRKLLAGGGALVAFPSLSASFEGALSVTGLTEDGALRVWQSGKTFSAMTGVLEEAAYVVGIGRKGTN